MIQAYLKGKLVIEENSIKNNEDLKTASSIGLLQYLPDDLFWKILSGCCNDFKTEEFGKIVSFNFWAHTDPTLTTNTKHVEPDVWVVTENYDIIIEAKHNDQNGQDQTQWENEIQSIINEHKKRDEKKSIILIALGGNKNMQPREVKDCRVFKASWYNLLNSVVNAREKYIDYSYICRTLDDVIDLMASQGIMKIKWLNTIPEFAIDDHALEHWSKLKILSSIGLSKISLLNINEKYIQQWKPIN